MLLNVNKNEVKVSVLSLVEDILEDIYGEDQLRRLSLEEYAKILAQISMKVLEKLVYVKNQKMVTIEKATIEKIVSEIILEKDNVKLRNSKIIV